MVLKTHNCPRRESMPVVRWYFIAFALILCSSDGRLLAEDAVELGGKTFGTTYSIKARGEGLDRDKMAAAVSNRLAEIDQRMSTWREDSDVSRFNASRNTDWFAVDAETASIVQLANAISRETNGAFDVTVGPAVRLWNFGASGKSTFELPSENQIEAVRSVIGHDKLSVRLDPPALKKSVAELEIDLSGIAKGYAVDAVCEALDRHSANHYMVEIGGEVKVRGTRPDGGAWRIGLEAPDRDQRRIDSVVSLENESLATSGDYRNYFEHDGVVYSHTIDPRTARAVSHSLATATVLADTCARADALATAILAMGPDAGKSWVEANDVKALLISRTADGIERVTTANFPSPDVQAIVEDDVAESNFLQLFLVTAAVFGVAVLAMSVGVIVANRRLQGSCGGMAGIKDAGGKTICDMCTKPSPECSGNPDEAAAAGQV